MRDTPQNAIQPSLPILATKIHGVHITPRTYWTAWNAVGSFTPLDHTRGIVQQLAARKPIGAERQDNTIMVTNRTITMYHITVRENWFSIGIQGLLLSMSTRRREKIGLVTKSNLTWAIHHTCEKHNCRPYDLIVVTVKVRRSTIRRNRIRGVWYSLIDITPNRIIDIHPIYVL